MAIGEWLSLPGQILNPRFWSQMMTNPLAAPAQFPGVALASGLGAGALTLGVGLPFVAAPVAAGAGAISPVAAGGAGWIASHPILTSYMAGVIPGAIEAFEGRNQCRCPQQGYPSQMPRAGYPFQRGAQFPLQALMSGRPVRMPLFQAA